MMQPEFLGEHGALTLPFDEAHAAWPGRRGARHRIEGFRAAGGMTVHLNEVAAAQLCGDDASARGLWRWRPRDAARGDASL